MNQTCCPSGSVNTRLETPRYVPPCLTIDSTLVHKRDKKKPIIALVFISLII
jgi:hypothetical protein